MLDKAGLAYGGDEVGFVVTFDPRQQGLQAKKLVRTKEAPQRQRLQLELRKKSNLQAGPLVTTAKGLAKGPHGTIGFGVGRGRAVVASPGGSPGFGGQAGSVPEEGQFGDAAKP